MALRPTNWLLTSGALLLAMGASDARAQEPTGLGEEVPASPAAEAPAAEAPAAEAPAAEAEVDVLPSELVPEFRQASADEGSADQGATARDVQADAGFAQMLREAESIQKKIDGVAESVSQMLREARNASDVVQQMCLDDKLNQIDVAGSTAETSVASMKAGSAAGDAGEVQRGYAVMQALGESANLLSGEANQCIGEQKKFAGGASLNVTVDPEIPRNDTTGGEVAGTPNSVPNTVDIQPPPPSVSPVM